MENEQTTTRSKRDDLIRRGDVLDKVVIYPNYSENGLSVDSYVVFDDDIMDIPAVDAVEVRHGRWEGNYPQAMFRLKRCSACETLAPEGWYCFFCGAMMDGEEEHNAAD